MLCCCVCDTSTERQCRFLFVFPRLHLISVVFKRDLGMRSTFSASPWAWMWKTLLNIENGITRICRNSSNMEKFHLSTKSTSVFWLHSCSTHKWPSDVTLLPQEGRDLCVALFAQWIASGFPLPQHDSTSASSVIPQNACYYFYSIYKCVSLQQYISWSGNGRKKTAALLSDLETTECKNAA